MGLVPLLIVAVIGYVAYSSGALTAVGLAPPASVPVPGTIPASSVTANQTAGLQPNSSFSASVIQQELPSNTASLGVGIAGSIGSSAKVLASIGVSANVVPVVGQAVAAVAAITAALLAAHNKRIQAARSENTAMNNGVAGYDAGMKQINAAYNARTIAASDAISLVQMVIAQYWAEVTPVIQSGRNGCKGGTACPPWPAKGNGCSGDIGAACCVGCYDLAGGPIPIVFTAAQGGDGVTPMYYGTQGTIIVLSQGGGKVLYQEVVGSKYGGTQRNPYVLTWTQFSAA
jgi:hypothetical protein